LADGWICRRLGLRCRDGEESGGVGERASRLNFSFEDGEICAASQRISAPRGGDESKAEFMDYLLYRTEKNSPTRGEKKKFKHSEYGGGITEAHREEGLIRWLDLRRWGAADSAPS